jgi:hypothetical protein
MLGLGSSLAESPGKLPVGRVGGLASCRVCLEAAVEDCRVHMGLALGSGAANLRIETSLYGGGLCRNRKGSSKADSTQSTGNSTRFHRERIPHCKRAALKLSLPHTGEQTRYNALMTYVAAGWLSMHRHRMARSAHALNYILYTHMLMTFRSIQAEVDYLTTP